MPSLTSLSDMLSALVAHQPLALPPLALCGRIQSREQPLLISWAVDVL